MSPSDPTLDQQRRHLSQLHHAQSTESIKSLNQRFATSLRWFESARTKHASCSASILYPLVAYWCMLIINRFDINRIASKQDILNTTLWTG